MEVRDEHGNAVEDPDMDGGFLCKRLRVRADAVPVDDVEKFAWADDDYEEVAVYVERAGAPGLANGSASIEDLMVAVAELGALVAGE
jgi:hypothetical protein